MSILDAPTKPFGTVAASKVTNAVAIGVSSSSGVGVKADAGWTGITVFPQGNKNVTVEFGGSFNQNVVGDGLAYVTLVEVGPTVATRVLYKNTLGKLPNTTTAGLNLVTCEGSVDIGKVTVPRTFELQVLLWSPSGSSPGGYLLSSSSAETFIRVRGEGNGYFVDTRLSRIQSGESDSIWYPAKPWTGCPVVLLHGAGENAEFLHSTTQMASVKLAAYLAKSGIPCIAGDMGGAYTFANDTNMTRITSAVAAVRSAFPSCRQDKVVLLGVSMGGGAAARWAQQNPTQVAGSIGLIPAYDLDDVYQNNRAGLRALIGTAWGVTYPTALPSGANYKNNASLVASIPHLIGYSSVDTLILPSTVTAYTAGLTNKTQIITDTTFGHSDQAVGGMDIDTVLNFIKANAA